MTSQVLLHVSPHPDDEALGCPGALIRMQDAGWTIVNLVVSLGRPGQHDRRRMEAQAAADSAGFVLDIADPPAAISSDDDLVIAATRIRQIVRSALDKYKPALVVTASPHDGHHAHEVVSRATISAITEAGEPPRLWLWGIWADLPFPTTLVPFDENELERAHKVIDCYAGEVERNDYTRLLKSKSEMNSVLGPERVFGYGEAGIGQPYADLITECVLGTAGWELGVPRVLEPRSDVNSSGSGRRIGWWLANDSAHENLRQRLRCVG